MDRYNIVVVGLGYVGLSNGILLSQQNHVTAVDVSEEKVRKIKQRNSPISDDLVAAYLREKQLLLEAVTDGTGAYSQADFIVISTPTDFDRKKRYFDTSSVEAILRDIFKINRKAAVIIKSTVPVGFTKKMCGFYNTDRIMFCPEFLREGYALYDNLYPSRIVIGANTQQAMEKAHIFAGLMRGGAQTNDIPVHYMNSTEAEAVKLFSNTYLALRVSFFNELDTYAETKGLDARSIIDGVCLDPRIGSHYNNPSFGYGGYCLPKDTKQLRENYKGIPENIISAIVESNRTRKDFIEEQIIRKASDATVGIYRLVMKKGADNFRQSSVLGIIRRLQCHKIRLLIYEPIISEKDYNGIPVIQNFTEFAEKSDLIVANRYSSELENYRDKLYTRDIYQRDD